MAPKTKSRFPFPHRSIARNSASSRNHRNDGQGSTSTPGSVANSQHFSSRSISSVQMKSRTSRKQIGRGPPPSSRSTPTTLESGTRNADQDNDGADDTLNEIIMAVDMTPRGTVGCCFYVARDERLYCLEDTQFGDVDVVDSLKLFINPTVILLSTKIDNKVVERIDPELRSGESTSGDNDQFRLPFLLEVRPPSEFYYDAAKTKLVNLKLGDEQSSQISFNVPGELTAVHNVDDDNMAGQQGQLLRLAGWIDTDSRISIGCAGALISYLQRRRAAAYLPGDQSAHLMFRITTLEMFTLRETMFINADTLYSLQILSAEAHPHSHNRGPTKASSGAKEGLSVYGLFHHLARTSQGRLQLRQQFLRPSLNLDVINERLDTVDVFVRPENENALQSLIQNLKSIGNMRIMLTNLRKGVGGLANGGRGFSKSIWIAIRAFAFHALKIKDAFAEVLGGENLLIRTKIFEKFEGYHLAQVGRKISETVDFDRSAEESRTIILPNIDEELDQMKRTLDGLESFLNEVARKLSEKMPSDLRATLNVIYFPQIGFLVTVPNDPTTGAAVYDGSFDNPWERMFSTEEQVYFKNSQMREMDDHFGDVYGIISDREIEISHELAQHVLQYEQLLTVCSDICGELDSLLALAQGAKLYKLCRPQLTLQNVIQVRGGRHILQELTVSSFVANDTFLVGGSGNNLSSDDADQPYGTRNYSQTNSPLWQADRHEDGPSTLVLTGPNYSGKSVYLKQTALIVFMAHVGSFVPAESARIGLTDKILSRVTTRETVSRIQSAFMIDLQQISLALSMATRRSLLIIDEFGKGTESSDGAGLACAVLEHLLSLGNERPKVIGATHFHEIFEMDLLKPTPALAFRHMEVRVDAKASEVSDQIIYLYNLRDGRSTSSFGTCCAAMNGVPPEIIQRAENLVLLAMRGEDLIAACCQMPEDEASELKEAEQIARNFLEADVCKNPKSTLADILTISTTKGSHW